MAKRGEIWLVNFNPTVGAEIQKIRPAIIVSSDGIGVLPLKLVAPITDWKANYARRHWHVRIDPDADNGLSKSSSVDAFQLRGVDLSRFIRQLGQASPSTMEEIVLAIGIVIEYQ